MDRAEAFIRERFMSKVGDLQPKPVVHIVQVTPPLAGASRPILLAACGGCSCMPMQLHAQATCTKQSAWP